MIVAEMAHEYALAFIRKSGVKEWAIEAERINIGEAAIALAEQIFTATGIIEMAIAATYRKQAGTAKVAKPSGGDAAMTPTSLANGSYWQSAKIDLGATFADIYAVNAAIVFAATPTGGNACSLWWNPSTSATAGTDNKGGCSGTDAAYTGYSSNPADSAAQLLFVGVMPTTAQATATIQKGFVGYFSPPTRYGSWVILNSGGSAFHSSSSDFEIVATPQEYVGET